MKVERGSVRDLLDVDNTLELPEHVLHWRGFVYLPGVAAGAASLDACEWGRGPASSCDAHRRLRGSYVLSVLARGTGEHYVFTDAGGNMDAFLAGDVVSTSFLDLCKAQSLSFSDLDPSAAVELMDVGHVYDRRTLAPSIRLLQAGRVYELIAGAPPREHETIIPGIDVEPSAGQTIERFFQDLSASLRDMRVSVDLTGGSDSRLVAALLASDLDVEYAITGMPGNTDIEIAGRVARALGHPLHVLHHRVDDLEAELGGLFDASDSLSDMLDFHRLRQNALARLSRGVQVALGGVGGELYKDFWWLQDFPRYRSPHSNLERLFDLRFRAVALPPEMLTGDYARAAAQLRDRFLVAMRARVMPLNTQTYDRIYYEMKMRTLNPRTMSMTGRFLARDNPLMDRELVRLGYALPRAERFFNRFHRRRVTAAAPAAARLGTTEGGMSLSAEPMREIVDGARYACDKLRRLTAKARQRIGQTPLRIEQFDHPELVPVTRSSAAFRDAVSRLRAHGVLARSVDASAVPDWYVGRVLTLGLLAERLDG